MSTNRRGFLGRVLGLVAVPFAAKAVASPIMASATEPISFGSYLYLTKESMDDCVLRESHRLDLWPTDGSPGIIVPEPYSRAIFRHQAKGDSCRAYALRNLGPDHPDLALVMRKIERRFGPAVEMASA